MAPKNTGPQFICANFHLLLLNPPQGWGCGDWCQPDQSVFQSIIGPHSKINNLTLILLVNIETPVNLILYLHVFLDVCVGVCTQRKPTHKRREQVIFRHFLFLFCFSSFHYWTTWQICLLYPSLNKIIKKEKQYIRHLKN